MRYPTLRVLVRSEPLRAVTALHSAFLLWTEAISLIPEYAFIMCDPHSLLDREDIDVRDETSVVDRETFDVVQERSETSEGVVIVGTTTYDGQVLLVNKEWSDGWMVPGGGVESGEDWATAGRSKVEQEAGVTVEIDEPVLVSRTDYRLDGGDERQVSYGVFLRASPVEDEEPSDDAGWFDEVPEAVDADHEADVRLFFD